MPPADDYCTSGAGGNACSVIRHTKHADQDGAPLPAALSTVGIRITTGIVMIAMIALGLVFNLPQLTQRVIPDYTS
ncbi:hypothetical protein ACIRG5_28295 [Lentzea sp. NPDC102401]|uniref:hypothetical protein n=1 Tax=Lentzea sp. NPDC102401 TaxID=3364128 RepID=UPI003819531D